MQLNAKSPVLIAKTAVKAIKPRSEIKLYEISKYFKD